MPRPRPRSPARRSASTAAKSRLARFVALSAIPLALPDSACPERYRGERTRMPLLREPHGFEGGGLVGIGRASRERSSRLETSYTSNLRQRPRRRHLPLPLPTHLVAQRQRGFHSPRALSISARNSSKSLHATPTTNASTASPYPCTVCVVSTACARSRSYGHLRCQNLGRCCVVTAACRRERFHARPGRRSPATSTTPTAPRLRGPAPYRSELSWTARACPSRTSERGTPSGCLAPDPATAPRSEPEQGR